jgi:sulfur-oxidizing protein SoxY
MGRRGFLGLASAAVGFWAPLARAGAPPASSLERALASAFQLPERTRNGDKVPVAVDLDHPMTADHHVTRLQVVNPRDPVPLKGAFHLGPANGAARVAFQCRMSDGTSKVWLTVECNRCGTARTSRTIEIPEGAGGCAAPAPPREDAPASHPPEIRIAERVEKGRIERGEVVHVQVKMRHPNRTGLVLRDGVFVRESDPIFLASLEARYGGEAVCRFDLTAALSDDPLLSFALRATRDGPISVVLVNNRGERFEARDDVRVG